MGVYHWLVANGLWTGSVYAGTGVIVAGLLGWVWTKITGIHPWQLLKQHVHNQEKVAAGQEKVAKALDTSTPGGLADVVEAIYKEKQ